MDDPTPEGTEPGAPEDTVRTPAPRRPVRRLTASRRAPAAAAAFAVVVIGVIALIISSSSCACKRTPAPTAPSAGAASRQHLAPFPPVPGATPVGAPGPAVKCTQRFEPGASLQLALSSAAAGSVICLEGGRWANPFLSGVNPPSNVTVAAAPGETVYMAGLTLEGPGAVGNLTFQGIHFTASVQGLDEISGGLVFKYDTLERIASNYAFYFYGNGNGTHATQTGVSILYNQIDHVGECLELVGGSRLESDFNFSHNVCGPGIGWEEDADFGAHYIQSDGVNTLTVDNNAFEGPPDPRTVKFMNHLNVLHVWGTAQNVDFSNNIIWHTREIAQMLLLGDNSFPSLLDHITLSNNLEVTDPACGPDSNCHAYSMYSYPVHGMTWTHNTIIGSVWGVGLGWSDSCTSLCYRSSLNMTGAYNIAGTGCAGNPDCNHDYTAFTCAAACAVDHNVSTDGSADSSLGGRDNVTGWHESFRTTSWRPNSGSPWRPPPKGYYQPVGLPFGAGYYGQIGP